ncbi:uncharacterized protein ZBIST_1082 [Zygosaccharomyces bailii]|nr:uncharacterized protein ZBIST_1082 [Zygosaccharomyces bailii]
MSSDKPGGRWPHGYRPKVEVQAQNSLFLINYSDVPSETAQETVEPLARQFEVSVFIDIPTIDFYKDELTNTKLSKFNKQFKLHLLKESIYKCFTNGNEKFWGRWLKSSGDGSSCRVSIASSGSLRYVETIKFLVETVYEKLEEYIACGRLQLRFNLDASPTSRKWFSTFLDHRLLQAGMVTFTQIGRPACEMGPSPFKEYYMTLTKKFEEIENGTGDPNCITSVVIVTNSTGVKALLTILSDRPLTNFISRESMKMLHDYALKKSHVPINQEETPLKRESSSLLNFQNQLLTSNKDKSVRIRSVSLNRRANVVASAAAPMSPSPPRTNSMASMHQDEPKHIDEFDQRETREPGEDDIDGDDDDDNEDDENDNDEDDDGISFNVPSKLSRSGSSELLSSAMTRGRSGRIRSLSLMDPALRKPFAQNMLSPPLIPTDDEGSSNENARVSNIYVHDGDFYDQDGIITKRNRKRQIKLSRHSSANGLIPPEFYSRFSSPSTSASSSNTSLQNLHLAPGTFSKMAGNHGNGNAPVDSLFEKSLINKSFEESRSHNMFGSLIERLNQSSNAHNGKNDLALNFVSNKTIPLHMLDLDEEDLLMSGTNRPISSEETSDDDSRSNSTVVPMNREDESSSPDQNSPRDTTPTMTIDLTKIKLYDDPSSQPLKHNIQKPSAAEQPKPKYKKAVTLDLYGDDDLENSGGWLLGGNAR